MDFELHYSAEQEEFRKECRAWLQANAPQHVLEDDVAEGGGGSERMTYEQFKIAREWRKKLGEKGWLAPTWPKEYGGGGLSTAEAIVLAEEMANLEGVPTIGDLGLSLGAPAIMVWGTEDQKKRFLPPIVKGEVITWQVFTEPEAGSDLASLKTRATRDGDDYVFNGQKIFVGSPYDVDFLYTLAVTDPDAPRHNNIGAFLIPANIPGITIQDMDLFSGGLKRTVFFDDARVPASQLIGGETDGWRVAQSTLELEHGGSGAVIGRNRLLERLLDYCKQTVRNGQPLSKDPEVRMGLVDLWIHNNVIRLFGLRNYWMRSARVRGTYEGSQSSLYGKVNSHRSATTILKIMGPYALLDSGKYAPIAGRLENQQRQSVATHPGGTIEIQKVIIARRIGVSRTREQAAQVA